MRRVGILVGLTLAGGLWTATATASPAEDVVPMRPAATSVDHASFCDVPAPEAPAQDAGAGGIVVSFTVLAPGC